MAILGKFVNKTAGSRVGDLLLGVTHTTLAHSLPATNAEFLWVGLRSIAVIGTGGGDGQIDVWATGGNASLSTVSFRGAFSNASTPTVGFDVYSVVWHTLIR